MKEAAGDHLYAAVPDPRIGMRHPRDLGFRHLARSIAMLPVRRSLWPVIFALVSIVSVVGRAAPPAAEVVEVAKTFDKAPFSCRISLGAERDAFRVYRLSYPSPVHTTVEANNTVPAELYLPRGMTAGDPRRPAVICLHIMDGNVELVQIACSALAARGIPALWFNLPYYGPRSPAGGSARRGGRSGAVRDGHVSGRGGCSPHGRRVWPRGRRSTRSTSA